MSFDYLQSRYYDPELSRFINADALVSTGQGILGNNMFAYCRNNSVTGKIHQVLMMYVIWTPQKMAVYLMITATLEALAVAVGTFGVDSKALCNMQLGD